MGVYGIALAGWSSNSKYALLGGLRASAQMVSYEVAMGLSLIPVLLMTGNVSFSAIVRDQQAGLWYVLPLFLSFFIFLISGFAETNRLPFDLPEAESELIAGYHTEYSAMKFSFFFIAEYANVVTVCAMVTTLFFGGWDIPFGHWDEQGGVLQTLATGGVLLPQGDVLDLLRHVDPLDAAALPLRPAHGAGLEGADAAGAGLHHGDLRGDLRASSTGAGITDPELRALALFGVNLVVGVLVFGLLDSGCSSGAPAGGSTTSQALARARRGDGLMASASRSCKRPERQVSYVRATLKGMALTFKHMFEPKVTMQYPEEKSTDTSTGRGASPRGGAAPTACSPTSRAAPSAWPAGSAPRSARPTASSWCRARTSRATATR